MAEVVEVRHYVDRAGRDTFDNYLAGLADVRARSNVAVRINRLAYGNFGDCKPLREEVWELRIDWGPGYRVYYARIAKAAVRLLCGGDKRKQASDVERAIRYLRDYLERTGKR